MCEFSVSAWNNGKYGYGLKMSVEDRDEHFKEAEKTREAVYLYLPTKFNAPFREKCRNIKDVGDWLKENKILYDRIIIESTCSDSFWKVPKPEDEDQDPCAELRRKCIGCWFKKNRCIKKKNNLYIWKYGSGKPPRFCIRKISGCEYLLSHEIPRNPTKNHANKL